MSFSERYSYDLVTSIIDNVFKETLTAEERIIRPPPSKNSLLHQNSGTQVPFNNPVFRLPRPIVRTNNQSDTLFSNIEQHATSFSPPIPCKPVSYNMYVGKNINNLPMHDASNQDGPESQTKDVSMHLYKEYMKNKDCGLFNRKCSFCYQNSEHPSIYTSHNLKNNYGTISCPVLRKYICPKCRATGDKAHTLKYCPLTTSSRRNGFQISQVSKMRMANGKIRNHKAN